MAVLDSYQQAAKTALDPVVAAILSSLGEADFKLSKKLDSKLEGLQQRIRELSDLERVRGIAIQLISLAFHVSKAAGRADVERRLLVIVEQLWPRFSAMQVGAGPIGHGIVPIGCDMPVHQNAMKPGSMRGVGLRVQNRLRK